MDLGLKNKTVLITGASGGIGRATVKAFAEEGANVVIHRHSDKTSAGDLFKDIKTDYLIVEGDVTDEKNIKNIFDVAIKKFGHIDIIVANAGIFPENEAPIDTMDVDRFDKVIAVNFKGAWLTAREFFRTLKKSKQDSASLIFTSSTSGIFGEEGYSDYSSSKAALIGLALTLKNEIVRIIPNGRVNAVAPGWTWTPMTESFKKDKDAVTKALETRALRRIARPEDIARQIVILSSDFASGYITGQTLRVDGGMEGRLIWDKADIDPKKA